MRRVELFGYGIAEEGLEDLGRELMEGVEGDAEPQFLVAMNPVKVIYAERYPVLADALTRATVLYPDGNGIRWALRLVTGQRIPRVPGVDLAQFLLAEAERRGRSVFLLGGAPDVNRAAVETVRRRHAALRIAGAHHGYFTEGEEKVDVIRSIRESGTDVLLVAMGSPRQEAWIAAHLDALGVRLAMGVGGTFDVLAGAVRRAPRLVQSAGLEWAWRALADPAKIRRVLATRPHFILKTMIETARHRIARRGEGVRTMPHDTEQTGKDS